MEGGEKAFEYMMDTLKKIILHVEEASNDWWWFELGKVPILQVRRYYEDRKKLEYTPKLPVVDALKILYNNFEKMRNMSSKERVDIALKTARDLYIALLAVSYIMEAHDIAEKLHVFQKRVEKEMRENLDPVLDEIQSVVKKLREVLANNVFSWPEVRRDIEVLVDKITKKYGISMPRQVAKAETKTPEEGGEVVA